MIYWIYGNSGSGKTTLSKRMLTPTTIHLDGDAMRQSISLGLSYSDKDRRENNLRIARLASVLNLQGFDVIVSTVCKSSKLRKEVYWITKCRFIRIE